MIDRNLKFGKGPGSIAAMLVSRMGIKLDSNRDRDHAEPRIEVAREDWIRQDTRFGEYLMCKVR